MDFVKRFVIEDAGAEISEWALLVVVLALALLAGGGPLKANLTAALSTIGVKVNSGANTMNGATF